MYREISNGSHVAMSDNRITQYNFPYLCMANCLFQANTTDKQDFRINQVQINESPLYIYQYQGNHVEIGDISLRKHGSLVTVYIYINNVLCNRTAIINIHYTVNK